MQLPPNFTNPYVGTWNPAFPVPNGGIAATFTGFGWFKSIFTDALPESTNDMAYFTGLHAGILV